ncbi:MAG: methyltransferase FkbM family [Paenibacillus sp.]|jgi:hypothetical protein|nr:methyltransferase FkbM family [Paenibacillus sp.]
MVPNDKAVSMRSLGKLGRFGNQIFQYAFLKTYASKYNLRVETPPWIGQYLFGHHDPLISKKLLTVTEKELRNHDNIFQHSKPRYRNVDFKGYFLFHTKTYAPYKKYFRSLFKPVPEVKSIVEQGVTNLLSNGETLVGLHLRRGDYLGYQNDEKYKHLYPVVPNQWYLDWLESLWNTLDNPVLFLASDEPEKVLPDFKDFKPITSKDLSMDLPKASFYPDYYVLSQCNYLAISYSTFSFSASMLNRKGKVFVRPIMEKKRLVQYDPWNSKVKPFH